MVVGERLVRPRMTDVDLVAYDDADRVRLTDRDETTEAVGGSTGSLLSDSTRCGRSR